MSRSIYVLDTSYLIEIFGCGRDSNKLASIEVRKKLKGSTDRGGLFFVPLPCLFELGNHIADVKHDSEREKLVDLFISTVKQSLAKSSPWTITPSDNPEKVLPALLDTYNPLAKKQGVGLVDSFTIEEAARLKAKFSKTKLKVHIWTNDRNLKKLEPDKEVDSYLWTSNGTSL